MVNQKWVHGCWCLSALKTLLGDGVVDSAKWQCEGSMMGQSGTEAAASRFGECWCYRC